MAMAVHSRAANTWLRSRAFGFDKDPDRLGDFADLPKRQRGRKIFSSKEPELVWRAVDLTASERAESKRWKADHGIGGVYALRTTRVSSVLLKDIPEEEDRKVLAPTDKLPKDEHTGETIAGFTRLYVFGYMLRMSPTKMVATLSLGFTVEVTTLLDKELLRRIETSGDVHAYFAHPDRLHDIVHRAKEWGREIQNSARPSTRSRSSFSSVALPLFVYMSMTLSSTFLVRTPRSPIFERTSACTCSLRPQSPRPLQRYSGERTWPFQEAAQAPTTSLHRRSVLSLVLLVVVHLRPAARRVRQVSRAHVPINNAPTVWACRT